MVDSKKVTGFSGYVSQKHWKDSDKLVECTVECTIDGVPHKAVFDSVCPMTAIDDAHKNFDSYTWVPVVKA
jgi:hypothetical protein